MLHQRNVKIVLVDVPKHVNADFIEKAAHFYAATLLPKLRRRITITIRWTYSRKLIGTAEVEFDPTEPISEFTIIMNGRSRGWLVYQSLGHEMCHVEQWVNGRLIEVDDKWVVWEGKDYRWDNDSLSYWDLPWELEAMGKEYGLYAKFKAHYGLKGKDLKALTVRVRNTDSTPGSI